MYVFFILLFVLCLLAMLVGFIKPSVLKGMSRKKSFFIFGGAAVLFFIIAIATTPADIGKQTSNGQDNNSTTQEKTEQSEPPTTATLEQKVTYAINKSLGEKNNTDKPRVVGVEVDKYNDAELSMYKYKSGETVVGLLIKINASENITTDLQKSAMHNEATKVARAVFPLDPTIGDIIIWSQLPTKDQYGNVKDDTAIVYAISRSLFEKINWSNFDHRDLPNLLNTERSLDDRNNYFENIKF